ncbi:MAG: PEBP family protein [Cenarchaeum symbiont of Oopsacas minuta]|nr:PEBP family protein [Cenarchaeum symbiont of Oopsacas minuta]
MSLSLTSSAFDQGGEIPKKYGYKNENASPPLSISKVPVKCKSLALIMDDPDAKKAVGKVWTHWLVWNIHPTIREIAESSIPRECLEGKTDFNSVKYGGPAPPDGRHTYVFALYALDADLDLERGADVRALKTAMNGHILEETKLVGTYLPDSQQ